MIPFEVTVFRFTPHVEPLRRLLEVVGLRPELESPRGGYVELVGTSGRVHVHEGGRASTELNLRCSRIADAHAALEAAGVATTRWDESYGEQMRVPGPGGVELDVIEAHEDPYGYTEIDPTGARGSVTAVWYSEDFAADAAALAPYGFAPVGHGDEWWQALATGPGAGAVGLHRAGEHEASSATRQVELSLETDEDLDAVEARLRAAGYATERHADEFIAYVAVVDPDGLRLQVHAAGM